MPNECGKYIFFITFMPSSLHLAIDKLQKSPKPSMDNPTASLKPEA